MHEKGWSRRDFLGAAAILGGAVLLGGSSAPLGHAGGFIETVDGSADAARPATRVGNAFLESPLKVVEFTPWVPGETVYEAPNDNRWVAFRNDDGPWPYSSHETQAIFSSYGIGDKINPATPGINVRNNPDAALEYVANGNVLINHSYSHGYSDRINAAEMELADDVIEAVTGQRPELYAPPGLGEGRLVTEEAARLNKPILSTRVFIGDTDPQYMHDEEHIVATTKAQIRAGSIIVFHAETVSHAATRRALHRIIEHVLTNFVPVQMKTLLTANYAADGTRLPDRPPIFRP